MVDIMGTYINTIQMSSQESLILSKQHIDWQQYDYRTSSKWYTDCLRYCYIRQMFLCHWESFEVFGVFEQDYQSGQIPQLTGLM